MLGLHHPCIGYTSNGRNYDVIEGGQLCDQPSRLQDSSDDEGELDRILGGAESDKLEAINSSPQQPNGSQELLDVVLAPTNDAVSTTRLAPHEGRTGEL